jgi:PilZ domain
MGPRAQVTGKSTADRRRSTRTPHVAQAWVVSPTSTRPAEERLEVAALNLSRHGVAFQVPQPLPEGAYYLIEIAVGAQRLTSEVRIISCRRSDQAAFEVGAEFC